MSRNLTPHDKIQTPHLRAGSCQLEGGKATYTVPDQRGLWTRKHDRSYPIVSSVHIIIPPTAHFHHRFTPSARVQLASSTPHNTTTFAASHIAILGRVETCSQNSQVNLASPANSATVVSRPPTPSPEAGDTDVSGGAAGSGPQSHPPRPPVTIRPTAPPCRPLAISSR